MDSANHDIQFALAQWPNWALHLLDPPKVKKKLSGGQTNQSYLLDSDDGDLVLRLNSDRSLLLGINRSDERQILKLLSPLKLAPEHIFSDTLYRYTVFRYVHGTPWPSDAFYHASYTHRLLDAIKKFQGIQLELKAKDYAKLLESYITELENNALLSGNKNKNLIGLLEKLRHFAPYQAVICHHDLTPQNIIDTEQGLCILDWEYAGMGHPLFDQCYIESQIETLCDHNLVATNTSEITQCHDKAVIKQLIYHLNLYWHKINTSQS